MFAGVGAEGVNVMPISESLDSQKGIIPKTAGGLSACGGQYSDIVTEFGLSRYAISADFDKASVNAAIAQLNQQADDFAKDLADKGVIELKKEIFVEARYVGQQWELEIPCPIAEFKSDSDVDALVDVFHETHQRLYSVKQEDGVVECVNWKLRLTATLSKPAPVFAGTKSAYTPTPDRKTEAFFGGESRQQTPVFLGETFKPGATVTGPCIIEEPTTTVVVYPGMSATFTSAGNYILDTGVGEKS